MDFIQTKVLKNLSAKGAILFVKCLCGVFIALSFIIANTDTPILDMMSYSWGVISGSFLAPYVLALYCKKLNKVGAWCGIIGGFIISMPPLVCKLFFPTATLPFFGEIHKLGPHFATVAMVVSVVLCLLGTAVSSKARNGSNDAVENFYEIGELTK